MNRLVWLPTLILLAFVGTGCQSTKFPSPKWPSFAAFKKKDKELAPPSEHFDVAEQQQLASNPPGERKPTEIPGESPANALKTPSDSAKPTAPMVASDKSSPQSASTTAANQPIRKPYEIARSSAEGVKQAAGSLADDLQRKTAATVEQAKANANEVVGQFQQQGKNLTNAARNDLNQFANDLGKQAGSAIESIAPGNPAPNSSPAGGSFAFNRPASPGPSTNAPPPWATSGSSPASIGNPNPVTSNSNIPTNTQVDPLKSLAASAALPPANSVQPNAASSTGFNPVSESGSGRQLQPIGQQMVNQNLGSQTANPASNPASSQFQLPVAQPPAFVANRSASPAAAPASAPFNSAPTASASALSAQSVGAPSPAAFTPTQPAPQSAALPLQNSPSASAGSNKYPSTGFNSFVASGSGPSTTSSSNGGNSPFNPPTAASTGLNPQSTKVNAGWQNQATPISTTNSAGDAATNRPVSHSAELPTELMQRSGGYAPGSVGGASGETLWR